MDCVFQIGEISKFFNIPASTLRFWEESGVLIPEKNPENQYRTYTVSDLMTISDILFYKSLGLPLKQIRDMEQMGIPAHQDICQQQMEILRQQQSALEQRMEKLKYHMEALNTICQLQQNPYSSHIEQEHRGLSITYQQKEQEHYQNALWENHAGKYVVCLMKEEIIPGFPNDLSKHLATVQKKYETGYVISHFLSCAQENGKTYDFYKTYIEVV